MVLTPQLDYRVVNEGQHDDRIDQGIGVFFSESLKSYKPQRDYRVVSFSLRFNVDILFRYASTGTS